MFQMNARKAACLILTLFPMVAAHAATISGHVYDERNGIYLESVRITIAGTDISTISERGGRYRLGNVEPGSHIVQASMFGYPVLRQEITVADPYDQLTLNFTYDAGEVVELEAFVVEGTLIGQAKALNVRRGADELKEVISSDAFGQFTDRNPADALQRVAGITVEDDQGEGAFVIIRGAGPELSNIQIDGISLATPQEDGRRVNLNVITVDQLERIEVSKTWLPHQSGNVIGGTVNLITRSALDRGEMFASVEGAYTSRRIQPDRTSHRFAVTFGHVLDGKSLAWLGDRAIGLQVSVNQSLDHSGSHTVNFTWSPTAEYPHLANEFGGGGYLHGYTLRETRAHDYQVRRERLGLSARLEFRASKRHEFYASLSHNKFDDDVTSSIFTSAATTGAKTNWKGTLRLTPDIVNQLGLDPADPYVIQRLNATGDRGYITFAEGIALGELAYHEPWKQFTHGLEWPVTFTRSFANTVNKDTIMTWQGGGKHRLGDRFSVDWKIYNSEADRDYETYSIAMSGAGGQGGGVGGPGHRYPHIRLRADDGRQFNPVLFDIVQDTGAGPSHNLTWSTDKRSGGALDLAGRFTLGAIETTAKFGLASDRRDKSYKVMPRRYATPIGVLDTAVFPDGRLKMSEPFFKVAADDRFAENFGQPFAFGPRFDKEATLAFLRDPASFGADYYKPANYLHARNIQNLSGNFSEVVTTNYEAAENIDSLYYEQALKWRKWTLIYGARFERTENDFSRLALRTRNAAYPFPFISPALWRFLPEDAYSEQVDASKRYDYWLPAIHLRRQLFENADLRLAITRTIARPLFSDLLPTEIPGIASSTFETTIQLPSFDLRPMESVNYDISFDYYTKAIGLLSVALFYKDLDGAIYDETRLVSAGAETAPYAAKYDSQGRNLSDYVFEQKRNSGSGNLLGIEITADRKFDFLPGFLNGFGVKSNISWFDSEATLLTKERSGETVPLFQQPEMTANASLYYNKHGLYAQLSYNRRGAYLQSVVAGENVNRIQERIGDGPDALDIYVAAGNRWDFTMRYQIRPGLQIFFEAVNIANEPLLRYRGNTTRPYSVQYTQAFYSIGLKWNL